MCVGHYCRRHHLCLVWFRSDRSGRTVPEDWSEEPACGSAADWRTDTQRALSGHYKWLVGYRLEPNAFILIGDIITCSLWKPFSLWECDRTFPSRRDSRSFQRGRGRRHRSGAQSWGPSLRTAGQQGELLEVLHWPGSTAAHGSAFHGFTSWGVIVLSL